MPTLLRSSIFEVSHDLATDVVSVTRTSQRYESIVQCEQANAALSLALGKLRKEKCTLRYDLRAGPATTDPLIERILNRAAKEHLAGFSRVALLVHSSAGAVQMNRLLRTGGFEPTVVVFADELAAMKHLRGA